MLLGNVVPVKTFPCYVTLQKQRTGPCNLKNILPTVFGLSNLRPGFILLIEKFCCQVAIRLVNVEIEKLFLLCTCIPATEID